MPQRTTAQKAALAKGRENAHSSVKDFEEAFKKANTDLESATVKLMYWKQICMMLDLSVVIFARN